jgi:hypothetical protein
VCDSVACHKLKAKTGLDRLLFFVRSCSQSVRPLNFMYSRRAFVYAFLVATDLAEQTKLRYASPDKSISCATAFKLQDMNASNVNANLNRR